MSEILSWISEDSFCHGLILIILFLGVLNAIVEIVRALTHYYPPEEINKSESEDE